MEEPEEKEPLPVRLKYYTTLTLGTTACLSSFIFMFLIPWVLDPSISTLMANFDPEPVLCMTVQTDHLIGMKNCSWAFCKLGCTTEQYECEQIYVNYNHMTYENYELELPDLSELSWVVEGVPVFINIKGCGYPPYVNCSILFNMIGAEGSPFPCYYSRVDPNMIIYHYSWHTEVKNIILALLVPNILCGVSLGIVSYWWYPGCQKRRCQYQIPPDQEDASSNHPDGEDEEDEEEDSDYEVGESYDKDSDHSREEGDMKNKQQEEEKDRDTAIYMPEEKV